MDKEFAKVAWRAGDVQTLRPQWTKEQAEDWLADNASHIQDRLVELGWEVLDALLSMEDDS